MFEKKQRIIAAAILAGLSIIIYLPSFSYGFSSWDSMQFIRDNELLKSWENCSTIFLPGQIKREALYIPVTYISYMVDMILVKSVSIMHFINFALHMANLVLLYFILRKFIKKEIILFPLLFIFALHPLQVETVVWLMGRKDLLTTLFIFLSFLAYMKFREDEKQSYSAVAFIFYILAVLAKPSMIIFPAIFVLYDYLYTEKRPNVAIYIPYFIVSIMIYLIHYNLPKIAVDI
ncbi:MAG: hypothetical protein HRT89_13270, partial [Lentisphaeria bacterium]|nr:hypothetical protein [Lentisphaeria bacterium]NQZ69028.1 hypothetical protein [Lentisphaeria bacterium]